MGYEVLISPEITSLPLDTSKSHDLIDSRLEEEPLTIGIENELYEQRNK